MGERERGELKKKTIKWNKKNRKGEGEGWVERVHIHVCVRM